MKKFVNNERVYNDIYPTIINNAQRDFDIKLQNCVNFGGNENYKKLSIASIWAKVLNRNLIHFAWVD